MQEPSFGRYRRIVNFISPVSSRAGGKDNRSRSTPSRTIRKQLTANWHTALAVSEDEWNPLAVTYNAPSGSTMLTIWVINSTSDPMFVSDAHLTLGVATQTGRSPTASLGGPGIIRAMAQ